MRVVIVGAGLSGLYLASELSQSDDITQITIYEKAGRVGGKLRSECCEGEVLEHGAWRVSKDHHLVRSLIAKDMKMFKYPDIRVDDTEPPRNHCPDVSIFASRMVQLGIAEAANMDLLSGYVGADARPDDGSVRHQGRYRGVSNGYDSIAKRLHEDIIKCKKITVHLKHIVRNVVYAGAHIGFTVLDDKRVSMLECDRIVFACSAHQAAQCCQGDIALAFRPLTASIQPLELCRIHGHGNHGHTDRVDLSSPFYRHIEVKGNEWAILSYTSGKMAVAIRDLLTHDPTVSEGMKWVFWPNGTHMWRPAFNFNMARNAWNSVCVATGVYIIGESLSDMQGWCEGALRSVKMLLRQFNKERRPNAEIKLEYERKHPSSKIVFYRDRPIDVSEWASRHPGGPVIIEEIHTHTRKQDELNTWDITEAFDNAHLNDDAFRQLFALQVTPAPAANPPMVSDDHMRL
jgi:hypothetical protein